jgi:hypothetical protein
VTRMEWCSARHLPFRRRYTFAMDESPKLGMAKRIQHVTNCTSNDICDRGDVVYTSEIITNLTLNVEYPMDTSS